MTDHRAVAGALVGVVADMAVLNRDADLAALGVTAQAAIAHGLLAVEERLGELGRQQRLANLIALLNPELSTWSHIDDGDIVRQVRAFLDGGDS